MKLPSSTYTGALLAALALCRPASAADESDEQPIILLSDDLTFHFDFLVPLSDAIYGGADVGPVLGAAKRVEPGNMTAFSDEFYALANQTKARAEDPDNAYDPVNVRDTWFAAATYFRTADNYLHGNWSDPLIQTLWEEHLSAFDKGLAALPVPGERVRIPASEGNFTVEAIWYGASENKAKRPTMIIGNGFDAAQEDSYHQYVAPILARGWNCITYEGPGQSTVRRYQDVGFIPEWEKVVTPVVDYVLSEKADVVDESRLALVGNSLGGYLAARAAAYEPRLSAALLVDGVWELYPAFASALSPEVLALYEADNYTAFDDEVHSLRAAGELSTNAAWGIDQGLWSFYTHSPSELLDQAKEFHISDFVDEIQVPVFVGDAEYETFFAGQPQKVKDALGDRATLHHFTGVAGYHCQRGAGQELVTTMMAWLNKTLGGAKSGS